MAAYLYLTTVLLLLIRIQVSRENPSGHLKIRLLSFSNPLGLDSTGRCCDQVLTSGRWCGQACDYVVRVVIAGLNGLRDNVYISGAPITRNENNVNFTQHGTTLPEIDVPFLTWPSAANVGVYVYDYNGRHKPVTLVDWFSIRLVVTIVPHVYTRHLARGSRGSYKTSLELHWTIVCNDLRPCHYMRPDLKVDIGVPNSHVESTRSNVLSSGGHHAGREDAKEDESTEGNKMTHEIANNTGHVTSHTYSYYNIRKKIYDESDDNSNNESNKNDPETNDKKNNNNDKSEIIKNHTTRNNGINNTKNVKSNNASVLFREILKLSLSRIDNNSDEFAGQNQNILKNSKRNTKANNSIKVCGARDLYSTTTPIISEDTLTKSNTGYGNIYIPTLSNYKGRKDLFSASLATKIRLSKESEVRFTPPTGKPYKGLTKSTTGKHSDARWGTVTTSSSRVPGSSSRVPGQPDSSYKVRGIQTSTTTRGATDKPLKTMKIKRALTSRTKITRSHKTDNLSVNVDAVIENNTKQQQFALGTTIKKDRTKERSQHITNQNDSASLSVTRSSKGVYNTNVWKNSTYVTMTTNTKTFRNKTVQTHVNRKIARNLTFHTNMQTHKTEELSLHKILTHFQTERPKEILHNTALAINLHVKKIEKLFANKSLATNLPTEATKETSRNKELGTNLHTKTTSTILRNFATNLHTGVEKILPMKSLSTYLHIKATKEIYRNTTLATNLQPNATKVILRNKSTATNLSTKTTKEKVHNKQIAKRVQIYRSTTFRTIIQTNLSQELLKNTGFQTELRTKDVSKNATSTTKHTSPKYIGHSTPQRRIAFNKFGIISFTNAGSMTPRHRSIHRFHKKRYKHKDLFNIAEFVFTSTIDTPTTSYNTDTFKFKNKIVVRGGGIHSRKLVKQTLAEDAEWHPSRESSADITSTSYIMPLSIQDEKYTMTFESVLQQYWPAFAATFGGITFIVAVIVTSIYCKKPRVILRRRNSRQHLSRPSTLSSNTSFNTGSRSNTSTTGLIFNR